MKIIAAIAAVLVAAIAGGLAWLGMFTTIEVQERDMGPYPFVYVQDTTTESGRIAELTRALADRLGKAGVAPGKPAQVYYSQGRGIQNQFGFVVDRPLGAEALSADTFFRTLPRQRCLVVRFRYRNPVSYAIGGMRVESALRDYRRARGYADTHAIVILEGDSILYLQPIAAG